jgi:hypothetical protein
MANTKFNPLFESMDVDLETKVELQESFDQVVLNEVTKRMDEYVEERLTEEKQRLEEEYKEHKEFLVESLDGYMDTIVEEFIQENAPEYERQIDEAKTKTLLSLFDNMVRVAGVDMMTIAEAKDNSRAEKKIEQLQEDAAQLADKLVEARKEADKYLKAGLIAEMAQDLTILEAEKFEKLAEMVEFTRNPSYVRSLETIKESIVDNRSEDFKMDESTLPKTAFKHPETPSVEDALDFSAYL